MCLILSEISMQCPTQVILELAADLGITASDAHADPAISELTESRSELVCLALWLIQERSKVCHFHDQLMWRF